MQRRSRRVLRARGLELLRSRGVRAHSNGVAASGGGMGATFDDSGATSRARPSRTCERTCNFSDVVGCSRGASAAARGLTRRTRRRDSRVGGVTASAGNEARSSPSVPGANRGVLAPTRGRPASSRHLPARLTSCARSLRCERRRLTSQMPSSMSDGRASVAAVRHSMNAVLDPRDAHLGSMNAAHDVVGAPPSAWNAAWTRWVILGARRQRATPP